MNSEPAAFSKAELDYFATQRLGRLATVDKNGAPQNNPVSFSYNAELGTIDVGGHGMARVLSFGVEEQGV